MHMKALQDTFNSLGLPMRFKFAQVQELQNPAKPLVLESSLEMMRSVTEGAYPSVLPFMSWESYFIEIRAVGVRRLPFELPYPMKLISESQYQISGAQSDKDSGQNKFCRYSSEIEPSGNSFTLRFDCETNSIKGNADEFTTLHRMSQQAISRFHKPIPFQAS